MVAGASTGYSVATTLLAPVVEYDAAQVDSAAPSGMDKGLWAAAIQDAADAGLLNPEDYTITGDSSKTYTWIVTRPDGTHTIDLSQADDPTTAPGEVSAWIRMVEVATGDYVLEDITDHFGTGYMHGHRHGSAYGG